MPEPTILVGPYQSATVDLFGAIYTTRRVTRSVEKQSDDLSKQIDTAEDKGARDKAVALVGKVFDLLLEPGEGSPLASLKVVAAWEGDEVDYQELAGAWVALLEASRPT